MRVGNYTLSNLLGRGGTGEVYAAEDALGEPVAIKVLRPTLGFDAATVSSFIAEGVRTRDLAHLNVVRVLDVGLDAASGSCYLVMERIDGESLAARLARQTRLDEPILRAIAAEIGDGMEAAHARGVVHRDLKPSNIMLRGNAPVIIDFGIAKSLGASSAVVTERRVGTLAYMAPEQLADGLITPAADIWALGVMLFEAATGQLPFASFRDGRLPQLVDTPPRAATLAPISPSLDNLIARCLERDPGKRPASMAAIANTLRSESDERITEDVGARVGLPEIRKHDVRTAPPSYGGLPETRKHDVRTVSTTFLRNSEGPPTSAAQTASAPALSVSTTFLRNSEGPPDNAVRTASTPFVSESAGTPVSTPYLRISRRDLAIAGAVLAGVVVLVVAMRGRDDTPPPAEGNVRAPALVAPTDAAAVDPEHDPEHDPQGDQHMTKAQREAKSADLRTTEPHAQREAKSADVRTTKSREKRTTKSREKRTTKSREKSTTKLRDRRTADPREQRTTSQGETLD